MTSCIHLPGEQIFFVHSKTFQDFHLLLCSWIWFHDSGSMILVPSDCFLEGTGLYHGVAPSYILLLPGRPSLWFLSFQNAFLSPWNSFYPSKDHGDTL